MKKYIVIWNTESCCDSTGIEFTSLEAAKNEAKDILYGWMSDEQMNWTVMVSQNGKEYKLVPTEKQIEDWDYMIYNCYTYIRELDKDGNIIDDEDCEYWLSDEEYEDLGWMEWSKLKEKNNW